MQRAHRLFEPIERSHRLAALLLRHVLDEGDDGFGCADPVWLEIAMANDAFFRKHIRQDERTLLEFAELGDNRAAQRYLDYAHHDFVQRQPHWGFCVHVLNPPGIKFVDAAVDLIATVT